MSPADWLLFIGVVLVIASAIGIGWNLWNRYAQDHPEKPVGWWE